MNKSGIIHTRQTRNHMRTNADRFELCEKLDTIIHSLQRLFNVASQRRKNCSCLQKNFINNCRKYFDLTVVVASKP